MNRCRRHLAEGEDTCWRYRSRFDRPGFWPKHVQYFDITQLVLHVPPVRVS